MAQPRHIEISTQQYQELIECRDHHPKASMREKAAAILKVAAGTSVRQVALCGLLRPRGPKKVSRWINRYLAEGLSGLLVRQGRGRKPAFSPCQPAASGN